MLPDTPTGRRELLAGLSRKARGGVVALDDAAVAWGQSRREAAAGLARLTRAGWLNRLRRGIYYIPSLGSGSQPVADDPFVLASELFAPSYIGGWSAAEHWGLTEQIFRKTFVVTAANIRKREQTILGSIFRLVHVEAERVNSVAPIWWGALRIRISSPERTLVDACADPLWVGGVRHLGEMIATYRDSRDVSEERLAAELSANGTGAAHKRLGFLAEQLWPDAKRLADVALAGRSTGVIRLNPSVSERGPMNRHWGLWVNSTLSGIDE